MIIKEEFDEIISAINHIRKQSEDIEKSAETSSFRRSQLPLSRYFDPGAGLQYLIQKTGTDSYFFTLNKTEFCTRSSLEAVSSHLFVNYIFPLSIKSALEALLRTFLNSQGTLENDEQQELFTATLKIFLSSTHLELEMGFKEASLPEPHLIADYFLKAMLMTYVTPSKFFSYKVKECFKEALQEIIVPIAPVPLESEEKSLNFESISTTSTTSFSSLPTTGFFRSATSLSPRPAIGRFGRGFPTIGRNLTQCEKEVSSRTETIGQERITMERAKPIPNLSFFHPKSPAPASIYIQRPNTN